MDLRNHVLIVWNTEVTFLHVGVSLMMRKNLTLCIRVPKPRSGTWNMRLDDLNRKGRGAVLEAVYATTLLLLSAYMPTFGRDISNLGCAT